MEFDPTIVDALYNEYQELEIYLLKNEEISYKNSLEALFKKNLILSAASYFEHIVTNTLLNYCLTISASNELLKEFVKNKAISRQYHTYFSWNENNANTFFGLFGSDFSAYMKSHVKADIKLNSSIKAFLEIGNERNRLVHQNFASYQIEKTTEEIYAAYKNARYFVERIEKYLMKAY